MDEYLDALIAALSKDVYIIVYENDGVDWFLYDIEKQPVKQVLWSKHTSNAIHFSTSTEAKNIKKKHLNSYDNLRIAKLVGEKNAKF